MANLDRSIGVMLALASSCSALATKRTLPSKMVKQRPGGGQLRAIKF
uniref:Ribosomal protein n=1 Tax=Globodera pallida TaxID=36090 RepID=A0A183CKR4_GLOPA